ncbi:hypothetical protein JCM11251_000434 [Rhodosporidiobolus azoricus]
MSLPLLCTSIVFRVLDYTLPLPPTPSPASPPPPPHPASPALPSSTQRRTQGTPRSTAFTPPSLSPSHLAPPLLASPLSPSTASPSPLRTPQPPSPPTARSPSIAEPSAFPFPTTTPAPASPRPPTTPSSPSRFRPPSSPSKTPSARVRRTPSTSSPSFSPLASGSSFVQKRRASVSTVASSIYPASTKSVGFQPFSGGALAPAVSTGQSGIDLDQAFAEEDANKPQEPVGESVENGKGKARDSTIGLGRPPTAHAPSTSRPRQASSAKSFASISSISAASPNSISTTSSTSAAGPLPASLNPKPPSSRRSFSLPAFLKRKSSSTTVASSSSAAKKDSRKAKEKGTERGSAEVYKPDAEQSLRSFSMIGGGGKRK